MKGKGNILAGVAELAFVCLGAFFEGLGALWECGREGQEGEKGDERELHFGV